VPWNIFTACAPGGHAPPGAGGTGLPGPFSGGAALRAAGSPLLGWVQTGCDEVPLTSRGLATGPHDIIFDIRSVVGPIDSPSPQAVGSIRAQLVAVGLAGGRVGWQSTREKPCDGVKRGRRGRGWSGFG